MITPGERVEILDALMLYAGRLEGRLISIQQWLSHDRARGHDRHVSSALAFKMTVSRIGFTISGGHIYFFGKDGFQYAIHSGQLEAIEVSGTTLRVTERFEAQTERLTEISLID